MIIPGHVRQRSFQEALESNISASNVQNAMHERCGYVCTFRFTAPQRTLALRARAFARRAHCRRAHPKLRSPKRRRTRAIARNTCSVQCTSTHHAVRAFAACQPITDIRTFATSHHLVPERRSDMPLTFAFPARISQNALPARPRALPRCRKRLCLRRIKRLRGAVQYVCR